MEMGISNGCVMGLPNAFPKEYARIYKLICSGKLAEARKLNNSLFELDHLALTEIGGRSRYIHVYKTLLMWERNIPIECSAQTNDADRRLQVETPPECFRIIGI